MRVLEETHITLLPSIPSLHGSRGIASASLSVFLNALRHHGKEQKGREVSSSSEQSGKTAYYTHNDPRPSSAKSLDLCTLPSEI